MSSQPGPSAASRFTVEEFHDSSCPAIADDESDYAHLADAGLCVCGALVRAVEKLNQVAGPSAASREPRPFRMSQHEILEAMVQYGGGFVQALAQAFRAADTDNQRTLAAAFDHYFHQYDEIAANKAADRGATR